MNTGPGKHTRYTNMNTLQMYTYISKIWNTRPQNYEEQNILQICFLS